MIGRVFRPALGAIAILAGAPVGAQGLPAPTTIAVPPQPGAFPLGTGRMPGGAANDSWFAFYRWLDISGFLKARS